MQPTRRTVLKSTASTVVMTLAASAGLLGPRWAVAQADTKGAFDAQNYNDVVKAMGGTMPIESKDVTFYNAPDIAENGAVVPVGISSKIPKTEMVALLVEKNPHVLSAVYTIPEGTEPTVLSRVKMGQSSAVFALVKADGKYYFARKDIKVTLGGCGG